VDFSPGVSLAVRVAAIPIQFLLVNRGVTVLRLYGRGDLRVVLAAPLGQNLRRAVLLAIQARLRLNFLEGASHCTNALPIKRAEAHIELARRPVPLL